MLCVSMVAPFLPDSAGLSGSEICILVGNGVAPSARSPLGEGKEAGTASARRQTQLHANTEILNPNCDVSDC